MAARLRSEATEQEAVITWARWNMQKYPELNLLFHIPNGGSRNALEAKRLKAQGVKAGVSDLMLPVARGIFHGLFIEMKYGQGKPTAKQKEFIQAVTNEGYLAMVCWGAEECITKLQEYLKDGCGTAPANV